MIWLNPRGVVFDGAAWDGVRSVSVSRRGEGVVVEYGDAGPHPTFADVPRRRTVLVIERILTGNGAGSAHPSQQGTLSWISAPSLSEGSASQVTASVVITSIEHAVSTKHGMVQRIEAVGVSTDGAADPLAITGLAEQGGGA
ncbi:MAG: hypothetical protein ACTS3F_01090 [Phycisphaerales bacterium]